MRIETRLYDRIKALYQNGYSIETISNRLSVKKSVVRKVIRGYAIAVEAYPFRVKESVIGRIAK